ncbi:hypothetical protein RDV89_18375 [Nocardioides zeae]|uniref:Uncharacterized protein n=1 Tax=Nocardioides imazamoxiresistens TaxID=3231893 RepID=A0ABU3Q0Q4_9ACTN|nr:hypothetical protein [Nocardioides zeae]MDT9595060.1 hypothetical protein [Nocardioides zeae]
MRTSSARLAAAAVGLGLAVTLAPTPSASAAGSSVAAVQAASSCSTWQYRTNKVLTVSGSNVRIPKNAVLNARDIYQDRRIGSLYSPDKSHRYTIDAQILVVDLRYVTCW